MNSDDAVHAERREPATPTAPLDLHGLGDELLESARGMSAGRSARTLTPGLGATLKQTLLALCAGHELGDHPAPGPTTAQVLRGRVSITAGDETMELAAGQWAIVPRRPHDLVAHDDAVVLLTITASRD